MPFFKKWDRKIDKIELYTGKLRITCNNDVVLVGRSIGNCLGTDANGEDVDGVRFETMDGKEYDLIETNIKHIEYLD